MDICPASHSYAACSLHLDSGDPRLPYIVHDSEGVIVLLHP